MLANTQQILQIIDAFDKAGRQFMMLPKEQRAELFKSSVIYKIKDKARETAFQHFSKNPLNSDDKSRIALFIIALKSANATILKNFEFQPVDTRAYAFVHGQLFRELENITKLQRLTPWSFNWVVYAELIQLNAKIWRETELAKFQLAFFKVDERLYEYLALSYAFLSEVNFMSIVTMKNIDSDPFVRLLHDIEEDNGKMIQTQLRLLKDIDVPLSRDKREAIVEGKRTIVRKIFDDFLLSLCPREMSADSSEKE